MGALVKRRRDQPEATNDHMRKQQKRDKSGNIATYKGPLRWAIQQIASGALPVIGTELGRVIWTAIAAGALPWLWRWLFG